MPNAPVGALHGETASLLRGEEMLPRHGDEPEAAEDEHVADSNNLGHTFILVDKRGTIRWRRDYTVMYVPPDDLFDDIPRL